MKREFLPIAIFVLTLFCISCNTKKEQSLMNVETEMIDFTSFNKTEVENIPEIIIKGKKYVKLDDSNEDFLFSRINKIKIKNGKIYVLDTRLKKLIVFDQEGNGLGKVGRLGQGPGEYLQISDFDVNDSGNIYFIDGTLDKDRLFVFDENLKFVSTTKMPFEADVIQCLPSNKLLFGLSSWNNGRESSKKIAVTNLTLKIEQSYMQYDEYIDNSYWISGYTFIEVAENILYNKPIDNFVYEISSEGQLIKAYQFDFDKKNVPNEYKKDIENNLDKFERYCCLKNFVVINDNYILGTLWDKLKTKIFIIDRNNQNLYISEETADYDLSNMAGYYNNQIISFIYPGKYDDIQAANLPQDVKKYVEDENFVVCLTELK